MRRRSFLTMSSAGAVLANSSSAEISENDTPYLTPQGEFHNVERGDPLPYKLPLEKRREVGLERETWTLEILAESPDDAAGVKPVQLGSPRSKPGGNPFTFADLMTLAKTKAVQYLKVVSCNNISDPLGMGLWEGVPLRDVLWLANPQENYRSIYYDGYHNDDPNQLFQCWLPANRALEDPPGFLPVILCYKINGEWLTGERGGPVRMIVPEAYGFKSVKWLQRIVVSNRYQVEDTYAKQNNAVNDSWLKTRALFLDVPKNADADSPISVSGQAQVGLGGLSKVQWWVKPQEEAWPKDDPHFTRAPWQDAELLPLPSQWHGGQKFETLHHDQFQTGTTRPKEWPLRYTLCPWQATLPVLKPGAYEIRCRAIDLAGNAQPMPRPYRKSGRVSIVKKSFVVRA